MVIIHIYGARAIFLLFFDNQDTRSESPDVENGVSGWIFTHKNIKGSMVQQNRYSTRWEQNIVVVLHIYGALSISLLFYDHQDTESESWEI